MSNACRYARPLGPLPALGRGARAGAAEPLLVGGPSRTAGSQSAPSAPSAQGSRSPQGGQGGQSTPGGQNGPAAAPGDAAEDTGGVLVRWQMHADGVLTLEVTDGGAQTRPSPSSPSLTSHGGRGLSIVDQLASDWGVRDAPGEVTVWAALPARARHARRS
ncbi:ATP-binding protein [Kitasatospora sp. NPDC001527]|uniref:ATP-binding protein n=1 Tax=Kitasatospora sp. NPDC001527 TaxID=3154519 RepID=UPI003326FDEE